MSYVLRGACLAALLWGFTAFASPAATLQPTRKTEISSDRSVPPIYPAQAVRERHEGKTVLLVLVDANSRIANIRIEHGSGFAELDQAAIDAIKQWHFRAATSGGKPKSSYARVPFVFALHSRGFNLVCINQGTSKEQSRLEPGCYVRELMEDAMDAQSMTPDAPPAWQPGWTRDDSTYSLDLATARRRNRSIYFWLKTEYPRPGDSKTLAPNTRLSAAVYGCTFGEIVALHGWEYGSAGNVEEEITAPDLLVSVPSGIIAQLKKSCPPPTK